MIGVCSRVVFVDVSVSNSYVAIDMSVFTSHVVDVNVFISHVDLDMCSQVMLL